MTITMLEPLGVPRDFLDNLLKPLAQMGHRLVPCYEPLPEEEKIARLKEAQALIIANSPLGEGLLKHAGQLKYISVAFTGTDHLDKEWCKQHGAAVSNCSGYSTDDVAELTLGLMISLLRSIQPAQERLRAGGTKLGLPAGRLKGRTVGILGAGAIGLRVAELLRAFGCEVLVSSRRESPRIAALGAAFVPFDELLRRSDILSLHTPLTPETRGLINKEALARMKPGALLINCARGPVVDTPALMAALESGQLAGAALDVFDIEPPLPQDHPILMARNTLLTPHIAFFTQESMLDRARMAVENVAEWLEGRLVRQV